MPAGDADVALRYGSDQEPGIRRRGTRRFHYVNERTGKDASAADRRSHRSPRHPAGMDRRVDRGVVGQPRAGDRA